MIFHIFFNLSLNFAIRSSGSEPQSAPSLVFDDSVELLHLAAAKSIINLISILTVILSDVMVYEIVSFISFSDVSLLVYRTAINFCILIFYTTCNFTKFFDFC